MTQLTVRRAPLVLEQRLVREGVHPLLSRLYAARGVGSAAEVDMALERLIPPERLRHAAEA
ncbi:MAG: recJ, partial [Proteobacteria bacterium]|nr:recJ [Pseudomonadota bacterium]